MIEPSSTSPLPVMPTVGLQELYDALMNETKTPGQVRRQLLEIDTENSSIVTKLAVNFILKRTIIKIVTNLGPKTRSQTKPIRVMTTLVTQNGTLRWREDLTK